MHTLQVLYGYREEIVGGRQGLHIGTGKGNVPEEIYQPSYTWEVVHKRPQGCKNLGLGEHQGEALLYLIEG